MKLPKNLKITSAELTDSTIESIFEDINNHLSDTYGYCVKDYAIEIKINITDIEWDKGE